jgi:hypothetical protein
MIWAAVFRRQLLGAVPTATARLLHTMFLQECLDLASHLLVLLAQPPVPMPIFSWGRFLTLRWE